MQCIYSDFLTDIQGVKIALLAFVLFNKFQKICTIRVGRRHIVSDYLDPRLSICMCYACPLDKFEPEYAYASVMLIKNV